MVMSPPKVFIVQKQQRWDDTKNELVPKFDIEPAKKFGEIIYLLSPTAGPWNSGSIIAELKQKLSEYTPNDFLLLIGNPCIIGWTVALASQRTGGKIKLLQWSGKDRTYLAIPCDIGK